MTTMNDDRPRIEIYDSTLRDGAQALGVSLSGQDKLQIAKALDSLGVDYIEAGYPLSNPRDETFLRDVRGASFRHAKVVAFGMTRRKGTKADDDAGMLALLGSEAEAVTIVGKSWDLHCRDVLGVTEDENLAMIAESIGLMARHGRLTLYDAEHFFDGWRANRDCALATLRAAHEAGAACLVLCDTNGGSMPEEIAEAVASARAALPDAALGIHCHNDCGLATANTLAAVRHGATHVQGTMNGIGERCGNADLSTVAGNLAVKFGYACLQPGALAKLTDVSRFVYEVANLNFRENQPFVGAGKRMHLVSRPTKPVLKKSLSWSITCIH